MVLRSGSYARFHARLRQNLWPSVDGRSREPTVGRSKAESQVSVEKHRSSILRVGAKLVQTTELPRATCRLRASRQHEQTGWLEASALHMAAALSP